MTMPHIPRAYAELTSTTKRAYHTTMRFTIASVLLLSASMAEAFSLSVQVTSLTTSTPSIIQQRVGSTFLSSSTSEEVSSAAVETEATEVVSIDPKEMVKIFGRLAEKYIMLDESGGMCCYSACSDCEFRLPDGGYRMADQSSSRPKWIPVYEERAFEGLGKQHIAKWKTEIFTNGPSVTKDEFVTALVDMEYVPPLGGPYLAASAGKQVESFIVAEKLFHLLADGKDKLARHKMSVRLKELANGEQGLTWPAFQEAMSS